MYCPHIFTNKTMYPSKLILVMKILQKYEFTDPLQIEKIKRKVWIFNSITACLSSQKMSKPLGQLHPIAPKRHWILQCLCEGSKLHNWSIKVQFSFVFFQCTTTPLTFLHLKPLHLRIICNSKIFFIILKAYIKLE